MVNTLGSNIFLHMCTLAPNYLLPRYLNLEGKGVQTILRGFLEALNPKQLSNKEQQGHKDPPPAAPLTDLGFRFWV